MSIRHIINLAGSKTHDSQPVLRQGQIIQGKILRLYPGDKAQIQLGSQKLIAQLEASLTMGDNYHFQVQATGDVVHLKVLGGKLKSQAKDNVIHLMTQLGLSTAKQNKALLKDLVSEKVPFDKDQLVKAFQLMNHAGNKNSARDVAKEMIAAKLPMTEVVFQALYTKHTSGLSEQMRALLLQLKQDPNPIPLQQNLMERLTTMTEYTYKQSNPQDQFLQQMRQVLQFTGLNYENQLLNEDQTKTVKSMLIQLLHNSDDVTHDRAQQLLHFINGLQLNSVNESANFIQASLQLPGEKLALNQDIQLDFEGKKTESGEISADYCRILFYLDLANLNETVIDMNVQKRSVAITVYNDHNQLNDKAMTLKPMLKDALKHLDYHLSTVAVKPLKQMEKSSSASNFAAQGVDFRI